MDDPPNNPRVAAMLAALFGRDWDKLDGDVGFEKGPMETWVNAIEAMLKAADAADPLRTAIRNAIQEGEAAETEDRPIPGRTD